MTRASGEGPGPAGEVYDWYRRGCQLLDARNPAAAAALLEHAVAAEPASRSVREALARAQYASGRFHDALDNFAAIVSDNPTDDYAHFGWGLAAAKVGDLDGAVEHLALAAAMRPDNADYAAALQRTRAARGRD